MDEYSVSIVILATDETESLKKTVDYIAECCEYKPDKVIIVLSRRATQDCVSMCGRLKEEYNGYLEVFFQQKDGIGSAVRHGIDLVKTTHMIFFPADLAIELKSIDRMISLSKQEPEIIVKTSRWIEKGSFVGYNKTRLVLNFFAQLFLRLLFFSKLTDLTNPVQIIPVEYQKNINWQEDGFPILIEQTIVPVRLGYDIKEVPAKCLPRNEGESKNSLLKTSAYLITALRVRFTPKNKLYK